MARSVPFQGVGGVRLVAELVQQRGASLQDDHVVNDHGHQHHHHLELVVDPQEDGAGHQAEDAAVDQVLGGKENEAESIPRSRSATFIPPPLRFLSLVWK